MRVMRLLSSSAALLACQPQAQALCASRPDVVDPCGGADSGVGALPGTPDPGAVPTGTVGPGGGAVDRLWFATTGDTRPAECDQTNAYPKAAIAQIAAAMKALRVQFTLDLGDHMYVCNQNAAEAAWLRDTLTDADARATYTIVARHHPVQGTRTGAPEILSVLQQHKYAMILTAHNHEYQHDSATWQGRSAVVGLGGAGGKWGFGTVLQASDRRLVFVQRDANGNPIGAPWMVGPQ